MFYGMAFILCFNSTSNLRETPLTINEIILDVGRIGATL